MGITIGIIHQGLVFHTIGDTHRTDIAGTDHIIMDTIITDITHTDIIVRIITGVIPIIIAQDITVPDHIQTELDL
jgi:hypothetical protein